MSKGREADQEIAQDKPIELDALGAVRNVQPEVVKKLSKKQQTVRLEKRRYQGPVIFSKDALHTSFSQDTIQSSGYKYYLSDDDRCEVPILM